MNFLSNNRIYHAQHFYDIEQTLKTNIDFGNIGEYYDFLKSMDMSGILFKEIDLVYLLSLMKSQKSFDVESDIVFVKFNYFEDKYRITSLVVTRYNDWTGEQDVDIYYKDGKRIVGYDEL